VIVLFCLVVCFALGQESQPKGVEKVGGDVTAPRAIFAPDPSYTEDARQKGVAGTVSLKIHILPDGTTTNIRIVKSLDPGLDQSAVDTVSHWRFQPATKAGTPISVEVTVNVNFNLWRSGIGLSSDGVYTGLPCATKIDVHDIKNLLKKAYKGDPKSQIVIGCACEYGVGRRAPDRAQAIEWYRKAAESQVPAQYFLGKAYLLNFEYMQAYTWLKIANSGGYKDQSNSLEIVTQLLSASDLSKAEERVAEWKKLHGKNSD
jgi:TonB family protein